MLSVKSESVENRGAQSTGKGIGGGTFSVSRSIGYPNINLEDFHFQDWEECKQPFRFMGAALYLDMYNISGMSETVRWDGKTVVSSHGI